MLNVSADQLTLLGQLEALDSELTIGWDDVRGVAAFVRGQLAGPPEGDAPPEATVERFLARYGELFGPRDLLRVLRPQRSRADELGWTHLEFQQVYPAAGVDGPRPRGARRRSRADRQGDALEVYGARLAAHLTPDGTLIEVQSSCWRDVSAETDARLTPGDLRDLLTNAASQGPGFPELRRRMAEQKEEDFPLMRAPRLVVYPWQRGFRLTWTTYAYGVVDLEDRSGEPTGVKRLGLGHVFVDAVTGELFLFAPMWRDAETPDAGTGLAVTALGGPFTSRNLNIVRLDATSTYRLRDTTHARDIITYDAANSAAFDADYKRRDGLKAGTLPVSEDADGDRNWSILPTNTTVAQRTASQQPEVDLHHFVREAYEWYDALAGGRAGWDNGEYDNPPVPPQAIRSIAHAKDGPDPASINAGARLELVGGNWLSWLQFFDGDRVTFDYLSGSKFVVGHEYQHLITDFSFEEAKEPGLDNAGWLGAVQEGLSDVFGGFFSEQWLTATEISPIGQVLRNLVYPRDNGPPPATAAWHSDKNDHFGDRYTNPETYARGTILGHCAYLMGQGGVHRRAARTPMLIPVYSLGRETVGGKDMPRAARIWYRALTWHFSTHGALSGIPADDENIFRTLRDACVNSASYLYGDGSFEHRTTVLAWYAVGLHPAAAPYGADLTFLRWGWDWRLSRPYLGGIHGSSPDWSSIDLFIKNGSGPSEWNALINVLDGSGNPTQFENTVYCRVRNVGDQPAQNVQVQFSYAKAGTGVTTWLPVTDKNGNAQTLSLGTLGAGASSFADTASGQSNPPVSAGVTWYIPPLAAGETVNHFCLKATVTSTSDVNTYNNEVQSNVAYAPYTPGSRLRMAFFAGNPTEDEIELDLRVRSALPRGWKASIVEPTVGIRLRSGEERPFQVAVHMPPGADRQLEPPLDGELRGHLFGPVSGPFWGALTDTTWDGERIEGRFAGSLDDLGTLVGGIEGRLDVLTGEVRGRVTGVFQDGGKGRAQQVRAGVEACLRPLRRVSVAQRVRGEPIGGITIQVQVPMVAGPCAQALPPSATHVVPGVVPAPVPAPAPIPAPAPPFEAALTGKVARVIYDCFGDFTGFVLDLCPGERMVHSREPGIERLVREACENRWRVSVTAAGHDPAGLSRIEVHC